MRIIDGHQHFYPEKYTIDQMVELSRANGIEKICLSSAGERFGCAGNDWTLRAMEQYPDVVIGWAFFDLGRDAPGLIDTFVGQGFRGVKFIRPTVNYSDKALYPVYERVEKHGLPALFHTGGVITHDNDGEQDVASERMRPMMLDTIARAFPGMTLIGAHLGVPWYNEACMAIRMNKNLYFDLSGAVSLLHDRSDAFFETLTYWDMAKERLVYGTDTWFEQIPDVIAMYETLARRRGFDEALREKLFYGNMAQILKL